MSAQSMATTVVWTTLLEALRADHPGLILPTKAGPETTKVIRDLVEVALDKGVPKSTFDPATSLSC